jgi:allantoate deiminase
LDELGQVTDEPGRLTRTFLSPAMRRANALVAEWMREAGLTVREDGVGNLIGRLEAGSSSDAASVAARALGGSPVRRNQAAPLRGRGTPTLLLGSHLDTVRTAGRFDGALGVLLPIVALAELRRTGVALPFAVEVLGFSEEEGVRFSSAYLGSKGYTGRLRAADLRLKDADGVTVRQAIEGVFGPDFSPPPRAHAPSQLLGYVEVHIEQGPVLESRGEALGVVSAIAGQTRASLSFTGRAGHAGTTPMALRRDALTGAAEFILAAESLAAFQPPLVATVGRIAAAPGAANVIPGRVELSLDLRHPRDAARTRALRALRSAAQTIARRRKLEFAWAVTQENDAVACSPQLSGLLERSVEAQQGSCLRLPSGAGHDGVIVSALAPIAMLFVRCRGGLSHHPDEHAEPADLALALGAVLDFLKRFAAVSPLS